MRFFARNHRWLGYLSLMIQMACAYVLLLFLTSASFAQFKSPSAPIISPPAERDKLTAVGGQQSELAARAIAALRRLDAKVFIYRSLGDFEENPKLARVSFEAFKSDLQEVMNEVEPILTLLPTSSLKFAIINALSSYRDGVFSWTTFHHAEVVQVSALRFVESTQTPSDEFYATTIPYRVAVHWRQARNYLERAEAITTKSIP